MSKKPQTRRQITIVEQSGEPFADIHALQREALPALAGDITSTMRRLLDVGALVIVSGRVTVCEAKTQ